MKNEIDNWMTYKDIPGFGGIFLDEVHSHFETTHDFLGIDSIQYYQEVSRIKTP